MKNLKKLFRVSIVLILLSVSQITFSQKKEQSYKDFVIENPDAETDIKVVSDYVNALVNNEMAKAEQLLAEKYIGYGPAINDSINKQNSMDSWKEIHKVRTDQKVSFVTQSFRVLQGNLKGDWVSQWGNYSFTQNGKTVKLPYQYTARVANGKINRSSIYFDNLSVLKQLGYKVTPPKQ
jgi:predicted SnoaL-like aldol condensation-catalyzing enzyme